MSITERLKKVFAWIEQMDLRVGELWLHPKQIVELTAALEPGWDRVSSLNVRRMHLESKGVLYEGVLWGARVYSSEVVVENHVAALPDGYDAKLIDSAACMPF